VSTIADLQQDIRNLITPLRQATVSLGRDHRASGVVIAPGVLLTNAHAVRDRTIQVRFHDGRTVQGAVAGIDQEGDLAVITADTTDITPLEWSELPATPGTIVFAGHGSSGASMGLVTAEQTRFRGPRGRSISSAFEHNAALGRGASGGPVVGTDGRLLGINTARTDSGYQAIASSSDLRNRISRLQGGETIERPTLGIAIVEPAVARRVRHAAGLDDRDGVLVSAVATGSPAANAGLAQGDFIVAIDDRAIASIDDVHAALDSSPSAVTLRVLRGAEERSVAITFERPAA
jgi:serine protease Do